MHIFTAEQAANLYAARLNAEGHTAKVVPSDDPANPGYRVETEGGAR